MLGERQKAILKAAARSPRDPLFGKENEALEKAIDQVKLENPNAFLDENDFKERTFHHKPRHIAVVYKSYVKE
jgi:hypothetical protein